MQPGLNFKVPVMQSVVKMDVRTDKLEILKSEAYSKDLQQVDIHSVLNYNLDPKSAGSVYQQYNLNYEAKIVVPRLEASVKQTVAQYTAEELLNKRAEVASKIEETIKGLLPSDFTVSGYSLVNEQFSADFEKAIEAKQVAQQNAEKANNDLNRIKIEAEQRVASATAEAEAIKIQAQAINSQGGADYVQMKAIEKWNGILPTQMIPGATVPFINLTK
jgi:regulator of protease activity HflC (stomatin/prohibitin superfamily)